MHKQMYVSIKDKNFIYFTCKVHTESVAANIAPIAIIVEKKSNRTKGG